MWIKINELKIESFSVSELCSDAVVHANSLHGRLRLPLGHLPLFLPAERRRHRCRSSGLPSGPSQDPGGDAGGPVGTEENAKGKGKLRRKVGDTKDGRSGSGINLLDANVLKDKVQRWTEVRFQSGWKGLMFGFNQLCLL